MFCELAVLKMLFLEHEINLELVNIFVQNLKNGLIKLAKGAPIFRQTRMIPCRAWEEDSWCSR